SQISAFRAGWVGLYPLQDRTAVIATWDSKSFGAAQMVESLPVLSGLAIAGDAVVTPFEAGARLRPWSGNCVAIGDSAISLEPLDAVQLHSVHVGVTQLVALFPVDADRLIEADTYNEVVLQHARNVRDFQAAHYRLNRRFDEPFWDAARDAVGPETLDERIR